MIEVLEQIGLTENETMLYLGFIDSPHNTAAEMARQLKMDKSSAYMAAKSLEEKKLVIRSPRVKGSTYRAVNPDNLKDIYRQKKYEMKEVGERLDSIIQELKDKSKTAPSINISIEYGIDAHIESMEDSLRNNKEKLILEKWYMQNPIFNNKTYGKYVYSFVKKRIQKKISLKNISDSGIKDEFHDLMITSTKLLKEVRKNPPDADMIHSYRIYNDITEIVTFDESNDIIVVLIKDKLITELMKNMFYFVWNRSEVI